MSRSNAIETSLFESGFYLPISISKAQSLSATFDRLLARNQTRSSQSTYGMHNRKRSGLGEAFWQYRPYENGEDASKIDWRRSARGDQLYVKEKELESLRDYYIWIDCASSMKFSSTLSQEDKLTCAITFGLAIVDLILRSGDRVGLLGSSAPSASRATLQLIANQIGNVILSNFNKAIPLLPQPSSRSKIIIISDFLNNSDDLNYTLSYYADFGISGLVIMINDPSEVDFPFSGETQFFDSQDGQEYYAGDAQNIAKEYHQVFEKFKLKIQGTAVDNAFQFFHHITSHSTEVVGNDIVGPLQICLADF